MAADHAALFPGKHFISTALEALETKTAMSGDLARRKLVPALFELHRQGQLAPETAIVGFARSFDSDEAWRDDLNSLREGAQSLNDETLVVLASDHGNIEDGETRSHTTNPVPVLLAGAGHRTVADGIRSITDVAPAILGAMGIS